MAENRQALEAANLESNARYAPEVWDLENPQSLLSCLSPSLVTAAEEGRMREPDLYDKDEHELFRMMEGQRKAPTPTLNRLRTQLWVSFEQARVRGSRVEAYEICAGICSTSVLNKVLRTPIQAAWLLTPPVRYTQMLDETLEYGMKKLRAILDMDELKPNGQIDTKILDLKFKIVAMMDLRKNGAPTQKIEQKNLNLHMTGKQQDVAALPLEQLEQRAAHLRLENLKAQNLAPHVVAALTPDPLDEGDYEQPVYESTQGSGSTSHEGRADSGGESISDVEWTEDSR